MEKYYYLQKGKLEKTKGRFVDYVVSKCGQDDDINELRRFVKSNKAQIVANFHKNIERLYSVGADNDLMLWRSGRLAYNKSIKNKQEFEIGVQVVFLKTIFDMFYVDKKMQENSFNVCIDVSKYKKLTSGFLNELVNVSNMNFLLSR